MAKGTPDKGGEENPGIQVIPYSPRPTPIVPFVNKIVLRHQDDSFFLEGFFVDHAEIQRQLAEQQAEPDPKEGPVAVELPFVVRLALSPRAMAELAQTAKQFWEDALARVEEGSK